MRIISGKYRGMNLAQFKGGEIRPTADRVKESLFNILSDRVYGASVLDLFCGSGNLGIESLSRGAASVCFNDVSKDSISVLRKNLSRLREENYMVTMLDYSQCLSRGGNYDIIFIDPPYASSAGISALEIIAKQKLLSKNAIAVFERDVPFTEKINGLCAYDERRYGKTYITFFRTDGV